MRKLASIRRISEIKDIPGKDRIGLATVDGWHVIVQKKAFEVNGLCVYCEIDSVLPEKPEFEFLRSKNFRIRTMKMAGCISQGICFPLSVLPEGNYNEGDDVTEIIGVTQYEATRDVEREPVKKTKYPKWLMRYAWFRSLVLRKPKKRGFPSFISKTDETRIQNAPFFLEFKEPWVATEKIDGQSGTFALLRHRHFWPFKDSFEYIVCSRNLRIPTPDTSSYWSVSKIYNIEFVLKTLIGSNEWVAIQGECVGPGIQGNKYKKEDYDLYVFNVINSSEGRLPSPEAKEIMLDRGLKFVPILDTNCNLFGLSVDEVVEKSDGKSVVGDTLREGIVYRSKDGKNSFKAVSNKFLIHYNE